MTLKTRYRWYQALAFGMTFLSYCIYHAGRQPYSTTKSALNPSTNSTAPVINNGTEAGYAPFNGSDGNVYLGTLDTVFLVAYAVGLFISGPLGDRVNLRLLLGIGMLGSGAFLSLVGLYYYWNVHSVVLFSVADFVAGLFQSTGWPGCVVVMTRWFDRAHMGTIMGVWNAHSSIGNIVGKYAGAALQDFGGWQWNFIGVGLVVSAVGVLQLVFLRPGPSDVFTAQELRLLKAAEASEVSDDSVQDEEAILIAGDAYETIAPLSSPAVPITVLDEISINDAADDEAHGIVHQPLSLWRALLIPGVIEFGLALFFSKLVTYALMFWLPYYLHTLGYSDSDASSMSTAFDYGGIAGGVIAGYWSDWNGKRGLVSFMMSLACIPSLFIYQYTAEQSWLVNVAMLFVVGIMVNGPYTLISGAVCSDLGSHPSLQGNPLAMSTVTGIIDGFGSAGAALEGIIISGIYTWLGWKSVFYSLMILSLACCLTIVRVVKHEVFGEPGAKTDSGSRVNASDGINPHDASELADSDSDGEDTTGARGPH